MNCIENKIINSSGPLKPTILSAILKIYQNGKKQITAREVKDECYNLDKTKDWNGRLPAICNGMRNVIDCGWSIISEDRNFNEFTIALNESQVSLNQNVEVKKIKSITNEMKQIKHHENKLNWDKIKNKQKKKLLIIGCSYSKQIGGNNIKNPKDSFGHLIQNHRKLRMDYYSNLFSLDPSYFKGNIIRYKTSKQNNSLMEAYKRYNGDFYSDRLRYLYQIVNKDFNFSILIMSGLYGLLDFNDYIIDYHLEIKKGGRKGYNWCDGEINSIILSYVKSQRIEDENVFYCLSDSYRLALNPKDNWFNLWKGDDRGKNSAKELYDFLAEIIM